MHVRRLLLVMASCFALCFAMVAAPAQAAKKPKPRLDGAYSATATVTATKGVNNVPAGISIPSQVAFTPKCAVGGCKTVATVTLAKEAAFSIMTHPRGRTGNYIGKGKVPGLFTCNNAPVRAKAHVKVFPTRDAAGAVTSFTAAVKLTVPRAKSGGVRCKPSKLTLSVASTSRGG